MREADIYIARELTGTLELPQVQRSLPVDCQGSVLTQIGVQADDP